MLNYSEILDDTEKDVSESHSKLLDAVLQLDKGQRIKKAERSEPTLEVSEFHLVKSGISDRDTIQIHDLAKTLGKKGHHLEITKSLQDIKKNIHVLSKPLEKPIADKSYKEAKAHRQSKIKSKKFHRVQKKEKIKLQLKEFEELKKTNPEAALEKLEQLDRIRAEERMSLKHRNTGKWAKYMQIRAKYNKATRQELAQQLSISRDLTQKLKNPNDSDEEDEGDTSSIQFLVNDKENPWMKHIKTESEIDEFVKSYRKYWNNQNNELQKKDLNINTNDSKQMNNSSKDKQLCNEKKDKNIDTIKDFFKNQDDENIPGNLNKQMISVINESNSNSKEKLILNNDETSKKKIELSKIHLNKVIATSSWNVESIENITTKNVNSLNLLSNSLNNEKINKIFDSLEEKIQDQIESKLQCITQNYDKVEKKRKKYKNIEFEEDNFDGLEIQAKKQKPILDLSLYETTNKNNLELNTELEKFKNIKFDNTLSIDKSNKIEIDPNKYMNIKPKHLNTDLPIDITGGNDVLDDSENDEERCNIISEAFADDDVIEEFRKEKEEEVKKKLLL
uniref:U3 small nucleolar RNA-associated protein 14 A n=2 Tax=Apis cerana TaxID=7461 RepID=V9I959_APICE